MSNVSLTLYCSLSWRRKPVSHSKLMAKIKVRAPCFDFGQFFMNSLPHSNPQGLGREDLWESLVLSFLWAQLYVPYNFYHIFLLKFFITFDFD